MADTYAIVESGGKQYKVEKGETLLLDRLPAKEGDKVDLRAVMFRDSDVVTDAGELEKVKVEATVAEHLRGPKLKVFKYKAKKGYKRTQGHRSELTRVEITDLKKLSRKPAAKKAEPKAAAKPAAKKTATRKAPAKKAATRKPATKKGTSGGS
jgi:large subunit ribosomal protein L21